MDASDHVPATLFHIVSFLCKTKSETVRMVNLGVGRRSVTVQKYGTNKRINDLMNDTIGCI